MKPTLLDIIQHILIVIVIVIGIIIIVIASDAWKAKKWNDSIDNPDNSAFVVEVAFNQEIHVDLVSQEQFNERYLSNDNI